MFNLNINAEEFIPSENSSYMMEMKFFDNLEQEFVKMNEWLFEYCPLENINYPLENINVSNNVLEIKKSDEVKFQDKFKKNMFKPKLETIKEENEKKTYAEYLKN